MKDLSSNIEALLFVSGEPMTARRIAVVLKTDEDKIIEGLRDLAGVLEKRGLRLSEKNDEYVLVTAPEMGPTLEVFLKEEIGQNLSRAMLETLAVVVYRGPISRSEIDYIRAVNSAFTVRNLMVRGLIERIPDPRDSRVWRYRPSFDFMKYMGIEKLEDLPEYSAFRSEIETLLKNEKKN